MSPLHVTFAAKSVELLHDGSAPLMSPLHVTFAAKSVELLHKRPALTRPEWILAGKRMGVCRGLRIASATFQGTYFFEMFKIKDPGQVLV
jgi:hypothetical protein